MSNYDLKTNRIKRGDKWAGIIQTSSPSVSSYICFISPRRFHLSWVVHETLLWLSSTFHMSSFHNRLMEFSTFFRKKQHITDTFFLFYLRTIFSSSLFSIENWWCAVIGCFMSEEKTDCLPLVQVAPFTKL